jgi:beta-lactamase class D
MSGTTIRYWGLAVLAGATWCFAGPSMASPACTLIVEASTGAAIEHQGRDCDLRNSPNSTFKIALSVIGYDAGILSDAHSPAWPYKPEYEAWRESWKTTTDPTRWLLESVVWYSREITRRLGPDGFQKAVDRLDYGNRDVSGDPGKSNGLTNAWLDSSLKISPAEEVAFVRKILLGQLPVSATALARAKEIMPQYPLANGWTVHGKTGSGLQPNSTRDAAQDRQVGWFVGWAEKGDHDIVFAELIKDDEKIDRLAGLRARDAMLAELTNVLSSR